MAAIIVKKRLVIKNKKGWHARPCAKIMRILSLHPNITVYFEKDDTPSECASGNSIFELMKLGLNCGDNVTFTLHGDNEEEINTLTKDLFKLFDQFSLDEES